MTARRPTEVGRTLAAATASPLDDPGALLADRYRILGKLGAGGMGSVHRALDTELDEEVAIKLLRSGIADDAQALRRFRREVKLARRVTHRNVARTYDLGVHAGTRFITMELIEGRPLSADIAVGGGLGLAESLRIAAEIARGLAAAHIVGVIHRDLKPDNVMLAGDRVCLTDFGVARVTEVGDGPAKRDTVGLIGTPAYMAPEQVEGRPLDGRADVYALGVLLFECLTGRLPYEASSPMGMLTERLSRDPPDPRAYAPTVPGGVSDLVLGLLTRAREDRADAQTALERLDALRGERAGAVVVVPPSPAPRRMGLQEAGSWAVVSAFDGAGDPESSALAAQLDEALDDAFEGLGRFERVRPPRAAAPTDDAQLARRSGADLVLRATVRLAGPRVRVRLRLAERTDGHLLWHGKVDGERQDPFALEDAVVAAVRSHLGDRFSTPGTTEFGPASPQLREVYHRARALMLEHSMSGFARARQILESAWAEAPNDAWIASRLAHTIVRSLSVPGVDTDAAVEEARAEELALQALAIDPTISETYQTLGILRWTQGRTHNAVLAFREALSRDPFLAEAHMMLARLALESGRDSEAVERAHLALRVDGSLWQAAAVLAREALQRGDADEMEQHLARVPADQARFPIGAVIRFQFACWHRDADVARRVIADLADRDDWGWTPPLRLVARHLTGERPASPEDGLLARILRPHAPARSRAQSHLILSEVRAVLGAAPDEVLDDLEQAARASFDLAWLDRSPSFTDVRESPRFARARAAIAARVAEVWS